MPPAALELLVREGGGFRLHQLDCGRALLAMRPRPTPAVLHATDTGIILRSTDGTRHIRLSEPEGFLWQEMDGHTSVEELATAWFLRFGSFEFGQILRFVQLARRNGFLETNRSGLLRNRWVSAWFAREVRWNDVDAGVAALHAACRPIFRSSVAIAAAATVVAGTLTQAVASTGAPPAYPLVFAGFWLLHMIPHEAAHAVACVAFGRRVRAIGVSWRGVFVDTTDMYLSSRRNHATVALAGPASNLVLASVAALAAVCLPVTAWRELAGVAADAGFAMAFVAGWPFLFAGDGYHALSDALRAPRLRADAVRSVRAGKPTAVGVMYLSLLAATWLGLFGFLARA